MTLTQLRAALQAMLAGARLTPLDSLYRYWRACSAEDRAWFLTKLLTREERQALALTFPEDLAWQFAQGQRVHWAGADGVGTVVQQRVTFREGIRPLFSYLIAAPNGVCEWCYAPDLTPAPEEPTS